MKYITNPNDLINTDKVSKSENHRTQEYDMISCGLTKREYFAAMALSGLAVQAIAGSHNDFTLPKNASHQAKNAVALADSLITELNKDSK